MGSGTTALEVSLLGMRCIGVDISPLCVLLTRVKVQSADALDEVRDKVRTLLESDSFDPQDASIADHPNPIVGDFVQVARMTTLSDVARRGRDGHVSFQKNLRAMLESVEAHADALRRFQITPGQVSVVLGDATVDRSEYTTTKQMSDWAVNAGMERERELSKMVFGLYNVMKDEKILIFRKPKT